MRKTLTAAILLASCAYCVVATAAGQPQDIEAREQEEARLQKEFQADMAAIVADLNSGSFDRLVRAIDDSDMLERIFGLRLIDGRLKRDFREQMSDAEVFKRFIEGQYRDEAKDGMRARLLLVESRGDRGRAVVRFDLPFFQVNYLEYELRMEGRDQLRIVDWNNYLTGYSFSDDVGMSLVMRQPNKNAARKLIDFPGVREQQVFQAMEVMKAARDRNLDRFFQIYDGLDPDLKRQRFLLVAGLEATRNARKRRAQRRVLVEIARHHDDDPLLALSLLDYYFPDRQYDKALAALLRVRDRLRVEGGVMSARLSSTRLVMGEIEDAVALAEKAVAAEPDLELGWWALLRAQVATGDYATAMPALKQLQSKFGHTLDPDALSKDPSLKKFARSAQYQDWFAANGGDTEPDTGGD